MEPDEGRKPPRVKIVTWIVGGLILFGGGTALASFSGPKNILHRLGQVSVATWRDVNGGENLKLAAEIDMETGKKIVKEEVLQKEIKKGSVVEKAISKIASITSSLISAVTNAPAAESIKKIPEKIAETISTSTPPPLIEESPPLSPPPTIEPSPPVPEPAPPPPVVENNHPAISVIQISGGDSISIFNPSWNPLDVGGWKLRKRTSSGKEYSIRVFPAGSIIPAKGNFIWANSSNLQVDRNVWSSETIAINTSVALFDNDGKQIDAVAWGENLVNPFIEGSAIPNPEEGKLLRRRFNADMPIDTENNLSDFEIR